MAAKTGDGVSGRASVRRRTTVLRFDTEAARSLWRVNRVYWLVALYSGIWMLLRARGIGGSRLAPISHPAIGAVFVFAIINLAFRTRYAVKRGGYGKPNPSRASWIFTALDLLIVAAGLRLTGGAASGLWPLLFLVVVAETVLEPTREAWLVRLGAALALLAAAVPVPFHAGPWILEATTRLVFLMAVTSVARRLRENSDFEKAEIAALRAELALTEERSHLSREVHDGVGNSLAAAVLRLEVAAREVEKDGGIAGAPLLREEAQALRQAMGSVRDWTFWTRPWPVADLDGVSGSELLASEVERLSRRVSLPIGVSGAEILDEIAPRATLRLTVLRIVQEALTNVAKHAIGATRAEVALRREAHRLILTISDDGQGIDGADAGISTGGGRPPGCGVGIASMRERARSMGGTLAVVGDKQTGTKVTVVLPLA